MAEFSEWELKNFSCWSGDIHVDGLSNNIYIRLFPRGVGGEGEHLVVSMEKWRYKGVSELSFIGSDGSVICTRRPDADSGGDNRIFTGPKFVEVVAGIRRNEPLYKDRLILRWKPPQGWSQERSRTVIDAYSAFFKIKSELFDLSKNRGEKCDSNVWNYIHSIYCFRNVEQSIDVSACNTGSKLKDTKVKFKLQSDGEEKILARTSIWMINGDDIMLKHENDCILVKGDYHILPYGVPLKELQVLQTVMRFKIITGQLRNFECITYSISPDCRTTCFSKFCQIKSLGNVVVSDATKDFNSFPQPENAVAALTKDFSCLYHDHDFSDFEVRCGTVSFPTHRNILSARSPVLKAMLSGGMREAASGHVDVEDMEPHTLGRFLAFIYSGTSREDLGWEEAIKLFYAADKYQVPSLKSECLSVLCTSIARENVCDILSLADKHQDEKLISVAYDFILKNYNEVLGSENWEKFMSTDPVLVAKTLTHFAKNKHVKKSDSA